MTERYFVQEIDAEDTGLVLVRFASGMLGEIVTSWAFSLPGDWQFEVGAARGSLAGSSTRLLRRVYDEPQVTEETNQEVHTYTSEVTHFLDVLQQGEPNRAGFEHAARALQLIQAAYRSAAERRAVTLPETATSLT
jgi:predicted dehydrogenase